MVNRHACDRYTPVRQYSSVRVSVMQVKKSMWVAFYLTLSALYPMVLQAEDKVWYCEMTAAVETNLTLQKNLRLEKFKFTVNETAIEFGPSGFFHNQKIPMREFVRTGKFFAADDDSLLSFRTGSLQFSRVAPARVHAVSARCADSQ